MDITVFALCAAMSLMFCWFTVEAPTLKEKFIVAVCIVIFPGLIAAYDVSGVEPITAAVKGSLGPWVGVTLWQLHLNHKAGQNYKKILSRATEEKCSEQTSATERRQDAPVS